jgi:DNA-directed RNA polymerase specialized sigma24 family protein
MRGDLETLYDAHAHRLYAHCWSLLGDQGAADVVRDAFAEAVRCPPQGETVLWLHRLVRSVGAKRGAFARHGRPLFTRAGDDPLMRAAEALPADHRESLLLWAGEWLDIRDLARVFRVSPDGVRDLLHAARTLLERRVLDALMRGGATPSPHLDVIEAFEKGRLPNLLARRAPGLAPAELRNVVLRDGALHEGPRVERAPQGPLVVIGSEDDVTGDDRDQSRRRWAAVKGAGAVAGVAASVATGLVLTWPSAEGGNASALAPTQNNNGQAPSPAGSTTDDGASPDQTGTDRTADDGAGGQDAPDTPTPSPTNQERSPVATSPQATDSGGGATESPSSDESDGGASSGAKTPSPSGGTTAPQDNSSGDDDSDGSPSRNGPIDLVTGLLGSLTDPLSGGSGG